LNIEYTFLLIYFINIIIIILRFVTLIFFRSSQTSSCHLILDDQTIQSYEISLTWFSRAIFIKVGDKPPLWRILYRYECSGSRN
ncbi:hypothetical protein L9F63_026151, partial [Diploptera punctata]